MFFRFGVSALLVWGISLPSPAFFHEEDGMRQAICPYNNTDPTREEYGYRKIVEANLVCIYFRRLGESRELFHLGSADRGRRQDYGEGIPENLLVARGVAPTLSREVPVELSFNDSDIAEVPGLYELAVVAARDPRAVVPWINMKSQYDGGNDGGAVAIGGR
ncbi:hypothetical protein AK812_SmicGene8883 [Symbiodinium microadriaticum]|uniref:Uncharacterized protein n=1 Tax=Symbiodinium microadriaticum TaxID=2951 RepID=A0A1Q9EJU2_SYMMI|nr:hypothetical protein AK812_SmicGene8883 [Symbiodinium microadriaticum]